jgi:hypothetical protein
MFRVNAQGINADIDQTAEDLWSVGGLATFPAAAAATNVISSSADDDGDPAGTGAQTVRVHGLDADYNKITEDVTLNGTTGVTLVNEFLRVNLIEVLTAGSGLVNAGTISVRHTTTVLNQIAIGANRSQSAFWTAPLAPANWLLKSIYCSITNAVDGSATFQLLTKKSGGLWQVRWTHALYGNSNASLFTKLGAPMHIEPGEDVRLRVSSSATNTAVAGGFDLIGSSRPWS